MSMIIDGTNGLTFNDSTTQTKAGLVAGGTIASGTVTALSTSGITFPASQSASADANTLDDYEEGTWTPTIARTGSSYTFGTRNGYYTKVGRALTVQGYVQISAITTQGSGYITVTGLPFTNMSGVNANFSGSVFYNTVAASSTVMSVGIFNNETFLYLKSATRGEDPLNENTATGYLMFTITYFTA